MEAKIRNAIQRRLEEIGRDNITVPVKEELVIEATNMIVDSSEVASIINEITSDVVNQYEDSIRTLEVTLEIQEDRLRELWNEDFLNAALEDIVTEELLWSLPHTIRIKEITPPKDPLRQALENEVREAIRWSSEDELSDAQISGVVDKLINHDDMWEYVERIVHQLIREAR